MLNIKQLKRFAISHLANRSRVNYAQIIAGAFHRSREGTIDFTAVNSPPTLVALPFIAVYR